MNNIYATKILSKAGRIVSNDYIIGKIMGINYVMCNGVPDRGYGIIMNDDGTRIFHAKCTADQYAAFTKVVDEMYPDLCIFNCKE